MPLTLVSAWSQFLVCAALIAVAGSYLSRYGDVIAEKTGLSGTWIGLVLLASVTSLPELITGISAVTLAKSPNIALGDALGSCVFNLVIITMLDFLHRGEPLYSRASQGHILSAGFGVILIGFVGFSLLVGPRGNAALGHVGLYSPVIVALYAVAMFTVFRYERAQQATFVEQRVERYPDVSLRQAVRRYAAWAVVGVVAGAWLPFVGEALAEAMGWHRTFVGTLFVAFATSVPEIVVTLAAFRIGAIDMAIGNLFGSNLFDIFIVAVDDLFFLDGPLLSHVSPLHAVTALSATMMSGIAIVGLLYRPRTRLFGTVGWASLFLLVVYLFNSLVLYLYGE